MRKEKSKFRMPRACQCRVRKSSAFRVWKRTQCSTQQQPHAARNAAALDFLFEFFFFFPFFFFISLFLSRKEMRARKRREERKKQSSIISFDIFQFGIFTHPRKAEITIIMRASERALAEMTVSFLFLYPRAYVSRLLYCTFTLYLFFCCCLKTHRAAEMTRPDPIPSPSRFLLLLLVHL